MDSKSFIFNTSMPRSGSELMQVILHQNPDIYGSPTSPVLEYLYGARNNTQLAEVTSQDPVLMRESFIGFCRGGLNGYYNEITDRPVICDKSRGWLYYYKWVEEILGEKPKMICCVRDLRQVITSMEKIWRNNRHLPIGPDNPAEMSNLTVNGRANHWLTSHPIGLALQRLYDVDAQGILDDIHIVRYEDMIRNPKDVMDGIYNYLGMPIYNHDFENITKTVVEDSTVFGAYGNHDIRSKIEYTPNDYNNILGIRLADEIYNNNGWFFNKFY
jgi:sulfotransferase